MTVIATKFFGFRIVVGDRNEENGFKKKIFD